MDNRSFESGASATPPAAPASPSAGYPTNGNPTLAIPATLPGDYWFYQIGEEIRNVIVGAGLTPSAADLSQLTTAIRRMIDGGDYKPSVRAATTANITLSGAQTIDGVSVVAGDRVLVKNQTTGAENGIYVAAASTWSRAEDANSAGDLTAGALVPVESGTENAATVWMLTTDGTITLGTTSITFAIKSGGAQSLAANGYIKLPGGLILQWGGVTSSPSADVTWSYPITFPNGVFRVVGTNANGAGSSNSVVSTGASSTSGTDVGSYVGNTGSRTSAAACQMIAIGY